MANAPTTIAAIQALPQPPEGRCWINGSIEVSVSRCKDSTGKGPSKCYLKDSTGYMDGEFWGRSISQYDGQTIRISGKGISRGDYNGKKSISVPDKCPITILEDSPVSTGSENAATQGRGGSAQSGGSFEDSPFPPSTSTVPERVVSWFQCLEEVDRVAPKDFPLEMRKDVATTVWLSYKAKYSVHADPVFERPATTAQSKTQDYKPQWPRDSRGADIDGDDIPFLCAWKELGTGVF